MILQILENNGWKLESPASDEVIQRLTNIAPCRLPGSYLNLLKITDGCAGSVRIDPLYAIFYSASEVVSLEAEGTFKEFFPDFFVIGGSGGGDAIAFDLRIKGQMPLVTFDMTNIDLEESVLFMSQTFEHFIQNHVGDA